MFAVVGTICIDNDLHGTVPALHMTRATMKMLRGMSVLTVVNDGGFRFECCGDLVCLSFWLVRMWGFLGFSMNRFVVECLRVFDFDLIIFFDELWFFFNILVDLVNIWIDFSKEFLQCCSIKFYIIVVIENVKHFCRYNFQFFSHDDVSFIWKFCCWAIEP